jgi:hypothetical protein
MNVKPTIRITRASCSQRSAAAFFEYIKYLLNKKYDVIVTNDDPDLVVCSNLSTPKDQIDQITKQPCMISSDYIGYKRLFVSGEVVRDFSDFVKDRYSYAIGKPYSKASNRLLPCQFHSVVQGWWLQNICQLIPYGWMTAKRNFEEISATKKYFCAIVQNSQVEYRRQIFNKLHEYQFVRAVGAFETNVQGYTRGRDEKEGYGNKHKFMADCYFSLQIQTHLLNYFSQEKMIQAFAANTIPIFWGNHKILEDGWNPEAFINCHSFDDNIDAVVEEIKDIYEDKRLLKNKIEQPIFVDNILPQDYQENYVFDFLEQIIND